MIERTDDSTVYVFCTAGLATGGTELLHQLVGYLHDHGVKAYMYYYDDPGAEPVAAFQKYHVVTTREVVDAPENVLVLPEICFHFFETFRRSQIVLWWLSIDNYYRAEKRRIACGELYDYSRKLFFKQLYRRSLHLVFKGRNEFRRTISMKRIAEEGYLNAYQSEYARLYLEKGGISNLYSLKDYINTQFLAGGEHPAKKPQVLYNPKKGLAFTQELMRLAPDVEFVPLVDLSREQVIGLLKTAMLYIDFGNHPGKDRLPREAALCGCCILTGMRGAAANPVDIAIEPAYKFDEKTASKTEIVRAIRDILADYDAHTAHFRSYREGILGEEKEFYGQIDRLFGL